MSRTVLSLVFGALSILVPPLAAGATTWVVAPDGSGDYPTIQAAVDAAGSGDVIELVDGVFTGEGNRDVDYLGKAITIRSQSGDASACIVDCEASATDLHRGFNFRSGESDAARLENLTITNGWVENENPLPEGLGGGILVLGGSAPTISGVVLLGNTAMAGGGMFVFDGAPTIGGCEFVENVAWWGSGGGISCQAMDLPEPIADCHFRGNNAHQAGGGMATIDCEFTLERCEFTANGVDNGYGGGFECYIDVVCELVECTFVENSAGNTGGGVMVWFGADCTVRRCTLVGNTAVAGGSGIAVENADVTIANSILAFGGEEPVHCGQDGEVAITCSDVFGNEGGDWVGCIASQAPVPGNRSVDPLFCGESNPEAPYSLRADSPCAPNQYPCLQIGAWGVGCPVPTAVDSVPAAAAGPRLQSVVPNPFNPQTTITFALPRDERVRVDVHDLSGRRLAVLVDRELGAGSHAVSWNGRDAMGRALPSGAYLVRVETAAGDDDRKVVLVR